MIKSSICINENPIIIIDDDEEDISTMMEAVISLGINNEVLTFSEAKLALEYFMEGNPAPFFVLCDIIMPSMTGFQLREEINSDRFLKMRATPFIFLTAVKPNESVKKAFSLNVQGYFAKPKSYQGYVDMFRDIIKYWDVSILPRN